MFISFISSLLISRIKAWNCQPYECMQPWFFSWIWRTLVLLSRKMDLLFIPCARIFMFCVPLLWCWKHRAVLAAFWWRIVSVYCESGLSVRSRRKRLELSTSKLLCFQLQGEQIRVSVHRWNKIHRLINAFVCCCNQPLSTPVGQCKYRLCVILLAFKARG